MSRPALVTLHPTAVTGAYARTVSSNRVGAVDVARGVAMLFVCLSHFADAYFFAAPGDSRAEALRDIGMIASPMFMMLSGVTLGMLYRMLGPAFPSMRRKLEDRAFFLLIIAHVLITLASMPRLGSAHEPWRVVYITDVIAICLLVGCSLVERLSARRRVILGATIYVSSWFILLSWTPKTVGLRLVEHLVFGPFQGNAWIYVVPILPWLGVYLACTALGEHLGSLPAEGREPTFARVLLRLGRYAVLVGVLAKLTFLLLKQHDALPGGLSFRVLYLLTTPIGKLPPSPDYLLCYGGAALLITGLVFRFSKTAGPLALRLLGALGRSSMFVFVLQFFVYYTLMYQLRLQPSARWWPVPLLVSLVFIIAPAVAWDTLELNRFLSLRRIISWLRRLGAETHASRA